MENITYEILATENPLNIENCIMRVQEFYGHEGDTALHWHDGIEVTLVLEGKVNYFIGGKEFQYSKGEIAFVNSRVIHQAYQQDTFSYTGIRESLGRICAWMDRRKAVSYRELLIYRELGFQKIISAENLKRRRGYLFISIWDGFVWIQGWRF